MWDNIDDMRAQLDGTVIRYCGNPVFVDYVDWCDGERIVIYRELGEDSNNGINWRDCDLDYSPVPLGYTNVEGSIYYLVRLAGRRWKHGLDNQNLYHIAGSSISRFNFLGDSRLERAISKTIRNIYPSIKDSIEYVKRKNGHAVAFCRLFAVSSLDGVVRIYYKGNTVGVVDSELEVTWDEGYTFLQELYDEERYS